MYNIEKKYGCRSIGAIGVSGIAKKIYKMLIKDGKLGYIYSAKYASEDNRAAYPGQC